MEVDVSNFESFEKAVFLDASILLSGQSRLAHVVAKSLRMLRKKVVSQPARLVFMEREPLDGPCCMDQVRRGTRPTRDGIQAVCSKLGRPSSVI
jgi:hypothetical protein